MLTKYDPNMKKIR